jgi:hypothetical protein
MGGIYEVHLSDGLSCHDIHMKSHKVCFRHSKADRATFTDRQNGDLIRLLLFFLNKEGSHEMDLSEIE